MILQMADPVKELKEIRFTSEKEMQHFCEKYGANVGTSIYRK